MNNERIFVNKKVFEFILLSILVFEILRAENLFSWILINSIILVIAAFAFFSFFDFKKVEKIRTFLIVLITIILLAGALLINISQRINSTLDIHDGAIQTESAAEAILKGKNPYSISYESVLHKKDPIPPEVVFEHYIYSPFLFLVSVPFHLVTKPIFGIFDLRIVLSFFYLFAGIVGLLLVREKILFLIIFFFNPVLFLITFAGANEVVLIFFAFLTVLGLTFKKYALSSVAVALGVCTKILFGPFAIVYFLYLYTNLKRSNLLFQFGLFIIVCLIFYLPFLFWNISDFIEDLIFYPLAGGGQSHVVAGFYGLAPVLTKVGIISQDSGFPFYIFLLITLPIFLILGHKYFLRNSSVSNFCFFSSIYFMISLAFSRIVQSNYLLFPLAVFILGAFLQSEKKISREKI